MPGDETEDKAINLVGHAATFVRQWPDAPVDALYGHVASGGGVNLVLDVLWTELELPARIAWTPSATRWSRSTRDRGRGGRRRRSSRASSARPVDETTLEEIAGSFRADRSRRRAALMRAGG